eukprot:GHVU01052286.1.p3 GENE.GHVU01052286.1~~GHVU01052286.1.p3  ORF type:complete len:128 (-),score=3.25 GHVU01052286.1:47-430(-)
MDAVESGRLSDPERIHCRGTPTSSCNESGRTALPPQRPHTNLLTHSRAHKPTTAHPHTHTQSQPASAAIRTVQAETCAQQTSMLPSIPLPSPSFHTLPRSFIHSVNVRRSVRLRTSAAALLSVGFPL